MAKQIYGVQFDSRAQIERIRVAAKLKGMSFNAFVRTRLTADADVIIEAHRQMIAEQRKRELAAADNGEM